MSGQEHDSVVSGAGTADQDGILVVTVTGDLDMGNVETVREALSATLKEATTGVVLDLAVKFIASDGMKPRTSIVSHHRPARKPRQAAVVVRSAVVVTGSAPP